MGASLEVRDVSWGMPHGQDILHPTNFSVTPGEVVAIVGANGAGKSTLLRTLYRFHRPRTGQVLIGGEDIWKMSASNCARSIAAVLQEQPNEFQLNVGEIIALGRTPHRSGFSSWKECDEFIVQNAITRLGLGLFKERKYGTLSGGEKQRVMIARALAQDPDIIILDEPTNHLDIRHQLEVLALVQGLGRTIIFSIHDLNLAVKYADRILVMANGRSLAFGAPEQILSDEIIKKAFSINVQQEILPISGDTHFSFSLPQ